MRALVFSLILCFAGGLGACGQATLPALEPELAEDKAGRMGLAGWRHVEDGQLREVMEPRKRIYEGARTYFVQVDARDPQAAAKRAAAQGGLRHARVLSTTLLDPEVSRHVEPDPEGRINSVMLEGKIGGKSARAIALAWYGSFGHAEGEPSNSGVYVFMAPDNAFEALGGYAVLAARNFSAEVTGSTRAQGSLRPRAATQALNKIVAEWVVLYVQQQMVMQMMMGQTMAIQQQTLNQMMTYNNAMSTCAGMDNCSVEMDGTGEWYADIQ